MTSDDAYLNPLLSFVTIEPEPIRRQGPGTSMAFALRLVDLLLGADKAKEVAGGLLVSYP